MTNREISDMFDTLLNSYADKAAFGDQASKITVVLDEYEKSVLLTQAQDLVVKSYFDKTTNSQGQGFDDTPRRQVDFSSLIKVATLEATPVDAVIIEGTGSVNGVEQYGLADQWINAPFYFKTRSLVPVTVIINSVGDSVYNGSAEDIFEHHSPILSVHRRAGQGIVSATVTCNIPCNISLSTYNNAIYYGNSDWQQYVSEWGWPTETAAMYAQRYNESIGDSSNSSNLMYQATAVATEGNYTTAPVFDDRGILFNLPTKTVGDTTVSDVLFILNEKMLYENKSYVIVPLSYKEYDRVMSKPYAQPLKKQAWRLFQNLQIGFDIQSELIPKWDLDRSKVSYRLRYVRRPRPIVLEELPDGLSIDGVSEETSCELHPILHMDILNEAVRLAYASRGVKTNKEEN